MLMCENQKLKEGYILDYISGEQVKASPEEVEATQVFSKILVEDYGYPKNHIQTRPQFRVKASPSDVELNILLILLCLRQKKEKEVMKL